MISQVHPPEFQMVPTSIHHASPGVRVPSPDLPAGQVTALGHLTIPRGLHVNPHETCVSNGPHSSGIRAAGDGISYDFNFTPKNVNIHSGSLKQDVTKRHRLYRLAGQLAQAREGFAVAPGPCLSGSPPLLMAAARAGLVPQCPCRGAWVESAECHTRLQVRHSAVASCGRAGRCSCLAPDSTVICTLRSIPAGCRRHNRAWPIYVPVGESSTRHSSVCIRGVHLNGYAFGMCWQEGDQPPVEGAQSPQGHDLTKELGRLVIELQGGRDCFDAEECRHLLGGLRPSQTDFVCLKPKCLGCSWLWLRFGRPRRGRLLDHCGLASAIETKTAAHLPVEFSVAEWDALHVIQGSSPRPLHPGAGLLLRAVQTHDALDVPHRLERSRSCGCTCVHGQRLCSETPAHGRKGGSG